MKHILIGFHREIDKCNHMMMMQIHKIGMKACMVLHTAISNGAWNTWKETTQFIVDSYHYINHCVNDYLCHKWCNPAPLNGSASNLVVVEHDINGNANYK